MADVLLANLGGSSSDTVKVKNGTDTVEIGIIDDYTKLVIKQTTSAGVETFYEAALVVRS